MVIIVVTFPSCCCKTPVTKIKALFYLLTGFKSVYEFRYTVCLAMSDYFYRLKICSYI